jgi:serine/threonine protein kinase
MPARPDVSHISSTAAKLAAEQGVDQALEFVPRNVADQLVQRIDAKKGAIATMAMKDYKRTEQISQGHFSWGFRAVHREFNFPAFIKQARNVTDETRTVFKREAKILGSLSIPGIPAFREYCEVPTTNQVDVPCIIMELAPGVTCRELVKDGKPYNTKKTLWLVYRALSILNKLHTRYNTAHCDVGPDNILIDESDGYGSVNVVDFGLATAMNGSHSALYWNKDFCPPEFITSKPVTRAADYYSLGKTAQFLLTGGHMMEPLADSVPADVVALINEMMHPVPEARPCDYAELRKRIERIQDRI